MSSPSSFGTSRAGVAAAKLATLISRVEEGQRLGTKEEVRASVEVSLGTFNETLRLLQDRGLVTVRPGPGGGVFVAEPSPMARLGDALVGLNVNRRFISDAVRIRSSLEFLIVEDACRHARASDIEGMESSLAQMEKAVLADDGIAFLHANWSLHRTIAAVTSSEILGSLYTTLMDTIEDHTISVRAAGVLSLSAFHKERFQVHRDLVNAIADGDVIEAMKVVRAHNRGIDANASTPVTPHLAQ